MCSCYTATSSLPFLFSDYSEAMAGTGSRTPVAASTFTPNEPGTSDETYYGQEMSVDDDDETIHQV